jgi:hypothetical protein
MKMILKFNKRANAGPSARAAIARSSIEDQCHRFIKLPAEVRSGGRRC